MMRKQATPPRLTHSHVHTPPLAQAHTLAKPCSQARPARPRRLSSSSFFSPPHAQSPSRTTRRRPQAVKQASKMNPIQNIPPHQRQEFMRTLEELQVKDSLL